MAEFLNKLDAFLNTQIGIIIFIIVCFVITFGLIGFFNSKITKQENKFLYGKGKKPWWF